MPQHMPQIIVAMATHRRDPPIILHHVDSNHWNCPNGNIFIVVVGLQTRSADRWGHPSMSICWALWDEYTPVIGHSPSHYQYISTLSVHWQWLIPIQNMFCNPTHFGDSRRFDSCDLVTYIVCADRKPMNTCSNESTSANIPVWQVIGSILGYVARWDFIFSNLWEPIKEQRESQLRTKVFWGRGVNSC